MKEYLDKSKPYFRDIVINLQKSSTWEIQSIVAINFTSLKDIEEERVIPSKSKSIEFMPYYNRNEVIDELFNHFFQDTKLG